MRKDAQQETRRRITAEREARAQDFTELRALLPDWSTLSAQDDRDYVLVPPADLLSLMREKDAR